MRHAHRVLALVALLAFALAGCSTRASVDAHGRRVDTMISRAMWPALRPGDVVAEERGAPIRRGTVIVYLVRGVYQRDQRLLHRVVGLPGEVLSAAGGRLLVNGRPLPEPYLAPGTRTADFRPVRVPLGAYYVLGDNRSAATDSRATGPVRRGDLLAAVTQIVAPASRVGPIVDS